MATVIHNLTQTKVAGVEWDTPFPVSIDLDPSYTDINEWSLTWLVEESTGPNVYVEDPNVKWPENGPTVELHSLDDIAQPIINYFSIDAATFTGMADKTRYFSVKLENKSKRVITTSSRLAIEFKQVALNMPFTTDKAFASAGGDLTQVGQRILFTAAVYDVNGDPVEGMQVDYSMAYDAQAVGANFSLPGDATQSNDIPVILTGPDGVAALQMTCDNTHYLTLQAVATGSPEENSQSVIFAKIGDGVPINPAPVINLNEGIYTIEEGAYTFASVLSPKRMPVRSDTIFVVVNNKVSAVMSGAEFTKNTELAIADLKIDNNTQSNQIAYYVQNQDGAVTPSRVTPMGVVGVYVNKPDVSIQDRPMASPSLYPALAPNKVITDDYLLIDRTAVAVTQPGITVKIPALPANSPYINKPIVINFYLNGYKEDTYAELTGFKQVKTLFGSDAVQYATLSAAEARGYGVNEFGSYQKMYCEYYYQGLQKVYSGFIAYNINTTRP